MLRLVNAQSDATTICSLDYEYDAVGNPVAVAEGRGDRVTYSYDALNQLARERRSGDSAYDITYTYDAVGNRLTKVDSGAATTYTYDAGNELLTENAGGSLTTYTYDENGNTLTVDAAGAVTTMAWSYEDEMLTVEPATGGRVTMTYDGDHLRRKREEGGSTTKYLWDGTRILMDLDGSDATVARYTLAPSRYSDLVSQRRSGATGFYHFDAIGSTRAITAADGAVTDTYLYDAWGVLRASTGSSLNPYRYLGRVGYLREDAIDGYLLWRRHYRAGAGRFTSAALYPPDEEHPYTYASDSPMRRVDPNGRGDATWPLNSRICNKSSDQCVIAFSPPDKTTVLHPGECTSWYYDDGDFAYWNGRWYKCRGGHTCWIDDTPPADYPKRRDYLPPLPPGDPRMPPPASESACKEYCQCMAGSKVNPCKDVPKCIAQCKTTGRKP